MPKKVFVSGCYDLLHSGHVQFFKSASKYGDLYVSVGSDKTVIELKLKPPINPENERLFMVKSIKYVTDAFIGTGSGMLDFSPELIKLKPDIFIVNEDGDREDKRLLCKKLGIEYIVLKRQPAMGLPQRSSTKLKSDISLKVLTNKNISD
jgi:cytidyltransferase-like protein